MVILSVGDFCMNGGGDVLTPAALPQTAARAFSPSQGTPGHQASWQLLSRSSSVSFLVLLLQGMAVVPFIELLTALKRTQTVTN